MRKILAIAIIAVRSAIRSRVVASLLFILAVAMIGLPLTVKGDGTAEGQIQILLNYSLGFAALILSLSSLWAGCAAISSEITEKQIQMVATKPVHRLQIWVGKWLGLMIVNGTLLVLAGATCYAMLHARTGSGTYNERELARLKAEVLVARRAIRMPQPDIADEARKVVDEHIARGELPANVSPQAAYEAVAQQLLNRANTVPPGGAKRWDIEMPAGLETADLALSFRFVASRLGPAPVAGTWIAGTPESPALHQVSATNIAGAMQSVTLPGHLAQEKHVVLGYVNADTSGVSIVFDTAAGPVLYAKAGEFEPNFVRALLVLLAQLAFMSALGVTAGSIFSMPVATLIALAMIFMFKLSGFLGEAATQAVLIPWHGGPQQGPNWADEALRLLFKGVHALAAPFRGDDVLAQLSTGQLVSWMAVADIAAVQVVAAVGVLALFGAFVFSRRELALPS